MEIVFLGTGATMPSRERNVSSTAVLMDGVSLLFDCGEGTQRQMMRAGVSFMKVRWIALSHYHGDHMLGIPGLTQSMALSGRTDPLTFFGPPGLDSLLSHLKEGRLVSDAFPVETVEMQGGDSVSLDSHTLSAAEATHGTRALSFRLDGPVRPGKFNPAKAAKLGIPPGPDYGRLQRNQAVTVSGRTVRPSDVMGKPRAGPSVGYAVDTRPNGSIGELMRGVDVLIFDSTFTEESASRAEETGHSTSIEAARLAASSGARRLYLDHISGRYEDTATLLREARSCFAKSYVARDFLRYRVRPRG